MGYVLTKYLSSGQLVFTLWSSSTKVSDFRLAIKSLLSAGAYVESRGEGGRVKRWLRLVEEEEVGERGNARERMFSCP